MQNKKKESERVKEESMKRLIKKFIDLKFRKKLMLSYLFISTVLILMFGILSYYQARRLLVKQARDSIEYTLAQSLVHMNNKLERYNTISDYIAYDRNIMNAINMDYDNYYDMFYNYTYVIKPIFHSMTYMQTDISDVTVYNSGNLVRHGEFILPLEEIEDESWISKVYASSGNVWIYGPEEINVCRRMVDTNTFNTNILKINLKYNKVFEELGTIMDNYGLLIINEDGEIIYQVNNFDEKYQEDILNQEELLETFQHNKDKFNKGYIIEERSLEAPAWNICFYKPIKTLQLDLSVIIKNMMYAVIISIVMTFLLSILFSKLIVTRIELLTRNMMLVDENNFSITITSSSKDEIGTLIRTFGIMIHKIDTLIKEVYDSKLKQKEAEMMALQAQINPHFLYNVLSSINWRAIMIQADDISKTTQLLATFYRTALNKGRNIISVKEELENTISYIKIQSILHNESFEVHYDIEEEIYNYETIKLILQPIAENGIEHGLDVSQKDKKILKMTAKLQDSNICFQIEDNGIGISKDKSIEILQNLSKGYGMKNVNERIKMYYGDEYGIEIESTLGEGTKVSILVPASLS